MTLIKSISGIRGTIGGNIGENLTPVDVVKFTTAFATFLQEKRERAASEALDESSQSDNSNLQDADSSRRAADSSKMRIVVGRDARISGDVVNRLVCSTLQSMGVDVLDLGLSTTPTTEMAVIQHQADGGIIITASHNPMQWNALKLLDRTGEFVSGEEAKRIVELTESDQLTYATIDKLGSYTLYENAIQDHVEAILRLSLVDRNAIAKANFKVILDTVNSTGALALPVLLKALGVNNVTVLNGEMNGVFSHNPEPIPENLAGICNVMSRSNYDVGFVVDPDVDRLAIVTENGTLFNEEYTLVAVADYVLQHTPGNTVSNLSSSRALKDVSDKYGVVYTPSAVGEVNVVAMMKQTGAVIGGEGNGGVIYPELHYGRDALVGIALFLTYMAKTGKSCSQIRALYPDYCIVKKKTELNSSVDMKELLDKIAAKYANYQVNRVDGVRIDFDDSWVHVRSSNTEPIMRIYAEALTPQVAENIANKLMADIREMLAS
ncbi:MAG: phosphoglucosamine mutase [Bacteroidales bacterium]|nr:phosphoglucosamine mutase [Bacteroidales bacterium]